MKFLSHRVIRILVGFLFLVPVLGLAHELLVIAVATAVAAIANGDWLYEFVKQFLSSPVHAKIMLETLGGVQAKGVVVVGLPGDLLHALAPTIFLDPETIPPAAWVSAIVDKNSTVLGFFAMQAMVEFIVIVAGALILKNGLQKRPIRVTLRTAPVPDVVKVLAGLFLIAQATWAMFMLTLSPALAGLRDTGIGVGFSLFFQLDKQQYNWLMDQGLPMLIPMMLTATALGVAWLIGKAIERLRARFAHSPSAPSRTMATRVIRKAKIAIALISLLLLSPVSRQYFGVANTELVAPAPRVMALLPAPQATQVALAPTMTLTNPPTNTPTSTATPFDGPPPIVSMAIPVTPMLMPSSTFIPSPTAMPSPTATPSPTPIKQRIVELRRDGGKFALVVNNHPTYITGLNYNVNYTMQPDDVKRRYHLRDFQIMQKAGVDAVIGWGVYDHVTLDIAHDFNIGVIMPFELDAKSSFDNKNYRDQIKNDFRKFVLEYKDAPAVWGWNPGGDELLHRMETEYHRTKDKIQIASDFLLELSALAYSLDPNHVSIVKEPRDSYVAYIEESVRRVRAQKPVVDPGKYFIFAVNTYGKPDGISLVLTTTRQSIENRVGVALVVGEFAPFGLAKSDRPSQYTMIWNMVRQNSSLGGFAYVFGPDQPNPKAPNPYDPLRLLVNDFSLVDNEGKPVDGSLDALTSVWRESSPSSYPLLNPSN